MSSKSRTTCEHCDKSFSKQCHLYAHIRNIHKLEPTFTRKPQLVCPSCFGLFSTYSELRDHLITEHDHEIYREEHIFKTIKDFQVWKKLKEKELNCAYVKTRGNKSTGTKVNRTYYVCHRSLKVSAVPQNKNRKYVHGSIKLPTTCSSTLQLIANENNKLKAILFTPHIGHSTSPPRINRTKSERRQIAEPSRILHQDHDFQISTKDEIIPELIDQNCQQEQFQQNNADLKEKLNLLTELFSITILTPETKIEAGNLLDRVINIVSREENLLEPTSNELEINKIEESDHLYAKNILLLKMEDIL